MPYVYGMWRAFLFGLVAVLLCFGTSARAGASMPPPAPPSALEQIDQQIEQRWANFVAWQDSYLAVNGVYFQGLHSHRGVVPRSNRADAPTGLDDKPTDRPHTLRDFWNGNGLGSTPFSIIINVYSGPYGNGFTVVVETVDGGATWQRTLHHGPETWREHGWLVVQ